MRQRTIVLVGMLLGVAAPHVAGAQTSIEAAKALYESAAYEEALTALDAVTDAAVQVDVERYRAFCLVALDRTTEAETAIAAVVRAVPAYVPDLSQVSPRIRDAFVRTRRQLLPEISRRLYLEGKAAFERKDRQQAISTFRAVIDLADTSATTEGVLGELRMLASGFLELAEALPAADPPAPREPASDIPRAPVVTPPAAVKQQLPAWDPPDDGSRFRPFAGAIRVAITATGTVESAEIVRSVHPTYDRALRQAALSWVYEPARQNGQPVASEKLVEVLLTPRK